MKVVVVFDIFSFTAFATVQVGFFPGYLSLDELL